jgi:hypothetical protein
MKNKMKSKENENSATVLKEGIELGLENHEKKCLENGQETFKKKKKSRPMIKTTLVLRNHILANFRKRSKRTLQQRSPKSSSTSKKNSQSYSKPSRRATYERKLPS